MGVEKEDRPERRCRREGPTDMADGAPSEDGFRAPGEWERHEKCWMMWPVRSRRRKSDLGRQKRERVES